MNKSPHRHGHLWLLCLVAMSSGALAARKLQQGPGPVVIGPGVIGPGTVNTTYPAGAWTPPVFANPWEFINLNGNDSAFSYFALLANVTGMQSLLMNATIAAGATFILPNNQAFDELAVDLGFSITDLMDASNLKLATAIMAYHIWTDTSALNFPGNLPYTLNDFTLHINDAGAYASFYNAADNSPHILDIIGRDASLSLVPEALPSVIYVSNTVLYPRPLDTIQDVLALRKDTNLFLSTFVVPAETNTTFGALVNTPTATATLLVPSDDAFDRVKDFSYVPAAPDDPLYDLFLATHMLVGAQQTTSWIDGQQLQTMNQNASFEVAFRSSGLQLIGLGALDGYVINVKQGNILGNGAGAQVHIIDQVLIPSPAPPPTPVLIEWQSVLELINTASDLQSAKAIVNSSESLTELFAQELTDLTVLLPTDQAYSDFFDEAGGNLTIWLSEPYRKYLLQTSLINLIFSPGLLANDLPSSPGAKWDSVASNYSDYITVFKTMTGAVLFTTAHGQWGSPSHANLLTGGGITHVINTALMPTIMLNSSTIYDLLSRPWNWPVQNITERALTIPDIAYISRNASANVTFLAALNDGWPNDTTTNFLRFLVNTTRTVQILLANTIDGGQSMYSWENGTYFDTLLPNATLSYWILGDSTVLIGGGSLTGQYAIIVSNDIIGSSGGTIVHFTTNPFIPPKPSSDTVPTPMPNDPTTRRRLRAIMKWLTDKERS